jgi:hypothetical protein
MAIASAPASNAVEVRVGPNGVHVGQRHHHYDRGRHYRDRYRDCRTVVRHTVNRYGERVTVRKRVCR